MKLAPASHRCSMDPLERRCLLSAGDLDPTLGVGGRASTPRDRNALYRDSVVLANDKVLIAGELIAEAHQDRNAYILQRFNAGGSLDSSFGTGGTVTGFFSDNPLSDSEIQAMLVQPDGKILIRGHGFAVIARFNADGTVDTSFSGDGIIEQFTDAIGLAPDGKIDAVGNGVDLEKIFAGQHPDIYLRENDKIMVGTNDVAPFLAAFRNAFRVTYGFGFLYDRNFASEENNRGRLR